MSITYFKRAKVELSKKLCPPVSEDCIYIISKQCMAHYVAFHLVITVPKSTPLSVFSIQRVNNLMSVPFIKSTHTLLA